MWRRQVGDHAADAQARRGEQMTAGRGNRRRRWLRWLWKLPLLLLALSVLQVLALRFVDPPFSAFMAARPLQAWGAGDGDFSGAYHWSDHDAEGPRVPASIR